jgi:hypothetical protein
MKPNDITPSFEQSGAAEPVVEIVLDLRIEYRVILPAVLRHLDTQHEEACVRSDQAAAQSINARVQDILQFQASLKEHDYDPERSYTITHEEAEAATAIIMDDLAQGRIAGEDGPEVRRDIGRALGRCLGEAWRHIFAPALPSDDGAWLNGTNGQNNTETTD